MLVLDVKMLVKGAVLSLALGSNSSPLLVAAVQPTAPQSSTETYPSKTVKVASICNWWKQYIAYPDLKHKSTLKEDNEK